MARCWWRSGKFDHQYIFILPFTFVRVLHFPILQYDCEFYSIGANCDTYGNLSPNYGLTASQACCACGGGSETMSPTLAPTESPTELPSKKPSILPSSVPTVLPSSKPSMSPVECFDISPNGNKWHDADGEAVSLITSTSSFFPLHLSGSYIFRSFSMIVSFTPSAQTVTPMEIYHRTMD